MTLQYDDRQKTRIYQREQPDTAETHAFDERIGFTQPLTKPKGMFDGISIAQVIAGAAAAATSMLLASKIGIAGSVIGAAVSSAVTVICSQLYRHALEKSVQKLKLDQHGLGTDAAHGNGAVSGYGTDSPYRAGKANAGADGRRARIAPAELRQRAAAERKTTQRKVIIVSVALAAVAVALTAGIIFLGTAGEGLGTKPAPLLPSPAQQQPADTTSAPSHTPNATPGKTAGEQSSNDQPAAGAETNTDMNGGGQAGDQGGNQGGSGQDNAGDKPQEPSSVPDHSGAGQTNGNGTEPTPDADDGTGNGGTSGGGASDSAVTQ